jgi:hypothetical protein
MVIMQEDEKREFFRIHDRLLIEYRQISAEDFAKLKDFILHNSTQIIDKINEVYFTEEKEPGGRNDQAYAYMQVINKKLDAIIDYLHKMQSGETYHGLQTDVNISGAGLQFESDSPLQQGIYVELKVVIPVFPYPKITALCEVVRAQGLASTVAGRFGIAMKFLVINEKDRDILINYIFVKEREYLRQKKETTS